MLPLRPKHKTHATRRMGTGARPVPWFRQLVGGAACIDRPDPCAPVAPEGRGGVWIRVRIRVLARQPDPAIAVEASRLVVAPPTRRNRRAAQGRAIVGLAQLEHAA